MAEPMHCPACGAVMNRHADKLVAPVSEAERAAVDPALGGLVVEVHACPRCGATASRRAGSRP